MYIDYSRLDFELFYNSAIEEIIEGDLRNKLNNLKDHIIDLSMVEMETFLAGLKQPYSIDPVTFINDIFNCGSSTSEALYRQASESLAAMVLQSFISEIESKSWFPQKQSITA